MESESEVDQPKDSPVIKDQTGLGAETVPTNETQRKEIRRSGAVGGGDNDDIS